MVWLPSNEITIIVLKVSNTERKSDTLHGKWICLLAQSEENCI